MSRVLTINEHAHGDSAASPQDAHESCGTTKAPMPPAEAGGVVAAGPPIPEFASGETAGRPAGAERTWFTLDLPRPPSVNRFTAKLGNKSPAVVNWVKSCDRYVMMLRPRPRLKGPFEIVVTWDIDVWGWFDCDNRIKPLLDYLQRIEFIENDRWCRRLVVEFGTASLGCRIALRQWCHS